MDELRAPLRRARQMLSVRLLIRVDRGLDVGVLFVARFKKKRLATVARGLRDRPSSLDQSVRSFSQPWSGRVPSAAPISDHAKGEERERRGEKEKRPRA